MSSGGVFMVKKVMFIAMLALFQYGCFTDRSNITGTNETVTSNGNIMPIIAGKEYVVRIGETYQFEDTLIRVSSIWVDSIVAEVNGGYMIGHRISPGSSAEAWGITIFLVKFHYDAQEKNRWATIIANKN